MLEQLLRKLKGFLSRLEIYLETEINGALRDIFIQTLVKLFEVFALVTKYCQESKKKPLRTIRNIVRRTSKKFRHRTRCLDTY